MGRGNDEMSKTMPLGRSSVCGGAKSAAGLQCRRGRMGRSSAEIGQPSIRAGAVKQKQSVNAEMFSVTDGWMDERTD